ncbi:hypothetical protein [Sporomusa sp.]|uniref:hypothetical protein n=1 Tax=Sporomusa sp. TaxID=2078658 RepID=UPI002CAD04E0|nr:hypothetical protein [Sporomusa sp.]HWR44865.1 hypothetical protein [Sporomusa sp.]
MSEEQFDRLEKMMEQLIHMVGHNNAVTEELRQRMDGLEIKVGSVENKVDSLESKIGTLETKMDSGFAGLTGMVDLLGEKTEAVQRIESKLDVLNHRLFEQEAEINLLKRAK